jgi:GH25 family lysozyme M1 (1,4-beta-N-acetylmuramidase)
MDPLLVDVSSYIETLDWPALIAAGPPWHGAIVEVSLGTGGTTPRQEQIGAWFLKQWPAIRAAAGGRYGSDFFRGGYHYLLAGVDGAAQADHYLARIEQAGGWGPGDLWPIVDVEEGGNDTRTRQEIIDSTTAFAERVRAKTGRKVMLYGGAFLANKNIADKMGCSWLWYPSWTATLPPQSYERIGWTRDELLAWQYVGDNNGQLEGYPKKSPLASQTDISAITIAGGGANALEWLCTNLKSAEEPRLRYLLATSPTMCGADVLDVQQKLAALGYAIGALDGDYGPETFAAVRAFQRDNALAIDGIVGSSTRGALAVATKPAQPTPSPLGELALAEAVKHVGVKEDSPSSKQTVFGAWFGANGVPWSNIFVSYCFGVGAGYALVGNLPASSGAGVFKGKGCAYVPTTEAWLRATGMWIGRVPPLPGDLAIFNWHGGQPDHIGIVAKDLGNGAFETIEGNTSLGNNSDGGEVMRRVRYLTQVTGFGRITP